MTHISKETSSRVKVCLHTWYPRPSGIVRLSCLKSSQDVRTLDALGLVGILTNLEEGISSAK
jgi:hypothetical protein